MSTLEMDAIVAEVLRRIGLSTCSRRALLWLGHASDDMAVRTFLNSLEQESYVFTQILRQDEEPCHSLKAVHQVITLGEESALYPLPELIRRQDLVVVSGLTLAQLSNIRDLRIRQEIEELICEALRQGKELLEHARKAGNEEAAKLISQAEAEAQALLAKSEQQAAEKARRLRGDSEEKMRAAARFVMERIVDSV